jgi:opacity protein-like surface antigen
MATNDGIDQDSSTLSRPLCAENTMTAFRSARLVTPLTLALCLPLGALAEDPSSAPWGTTPYVGGSLGRITSGSDYTLPPGATVTRESTSATGGALFAGLKLGKYAGVEIAYLNLGSIGVDATGTGGAVNGMRSLDFASFNVVGFLPLGSRWEVSGRLGLALNAGYRTGETCYGTSRTGAGYTTRAYPCTRTSWMVGLGARYAVTDQWGARLDWLYVDYQDSREGLNYKPHFFGVGVDYRF